MDEHEISTPSDLNVELSANRLYKRSQLWRLAEGRSFRWPEAIGLVCAILLFANGISQAGAGSGTTQIAFGISMVGVLVWGHMQRQVNALGPVNTI